MSVLPSGVMNICVNHAGPGGARRRSGLGHDTPREVNWKEDIIATIAMTFVVLTFVSHDCTVTHRTLIW